MPTPSTQELLGAWKLIPLSQLPERNCNFHIDSRGLRTSHKLMMNQTNNSLAGRKLETLQSQETFHQSWSGASQTSTLQALCVCFLLCPAASTAVETVALAFSLGLSMVRLLSGTTRL